MGRNPQASRSGAREGLSDDVQASSAAGRAPRRTPLPRGSHQSAGPSLRPSGPCSPRTPSRLPGTPGPEPRRADRATPGSGRRSGCTDTRPGVRRGTRTTEAEASRPCTARAAGARVPSPAPAAEPATAPSAHTASLPAARRPSRPAAAGTLPPAGPRDVAADRAVGYPENGPDLPAAWAKSVRKPEYVSNLGALDNLFRATVFLLARDRSRD